MADIKQYIDIMAEGLNKKSVLLDRIIESNERLQGIIDQPELNMEQFRLLIDEKDDYVKQINQLDEGFQSLFDRIKEEVRNHKELYRQQIQNMQQMIRNITDKAVQIQEVEAKQRVIIEGQFAKKRQGIRQVRKGMNAAQSYYKSMSGTSVVDAQFMDKKK